MKQPRGFILAIDGPAGSGKSTTARLCAERLGFRHLDTGAMYRAVTMKIQGVKGSRDRGIEWAAADALSDRGRRGQVRSQKAEGRRQKAEVETYHKDTKTLWDQTTGAGREQSAGLTERRKAEGAIDRSALVRLLRCTKIGVRWDERGMRTFLDGRDVSEEIRSPAVSSLVSEVSAIPAVRRKMVAEQRRVASGQMVVCEGRDIGSVVFPDADLKIFIECDAAERARRRQLELAGQGVRTGQKAVLANLVKRDRIDSGREVSPLRRVPDAVLIDTTHLTIEEQVSVVCDLARRRSEAKSQKPKAKAGESRRRKADCGRR